ncbi:MAG: hypothetical protein ACM3SU_04845 [Acidobacteriota bacterium]
MKKRPKPTPAQRRRLKALLVRRARLNLRIRKLALQMGVWKTARVC